MCEHPEDDLRGVRGGDRLHLLPGRLETKGGQDPLVHEHNLR